MITESQAYAAGWNACMNGVDGRYAQQFVAHLGGAPAKFHDSSAYQINKELAGAWTHGWLDAMEAEDGEEPEPECAGYAA
jgi:hypothetical protein